MKKYSDNTTNIQELKDLVEKFAQERNWQRHHSGKNLSMNIAIEAAELMEHFQWERDGDPDMDAVADELADIIFNCLNFATTNNIDIASSFVKKYEKLLKKYPTEIFNKSNDSLEDYHRIKKTYRGKS